MCSVLRVLAVCGLFSIICGCGGGGNAPKLVKAEGVVTLNGEPLEGANVIFSPEAGPVATGTTDAQGRFALNTHGLPGAVLGTHSVSVSAYEPTDPAGITSDDPDAAGEVHGVQKSLIPTKYGNSISSGLSADVSDDAASNQFSFDLDG